jgi:HK97 family phage major capsid protein
MNRLEKLQNELRTICERLKTIRSMQDVEITEDIKKEMKTIIDRSEVLEKDIEIEKKAVEFENRMSIVPKSIMQGANITVGEEPLIYRTKGQQLMDIYYSGLNSASFKTRQEANARLEKNNNRMLAEMKKLDFTEYRVMNELVGSEGGFFLQENLIGALMDPLFATGLILPRCTIFEIGPNSNDLTLLGIDETSRVEGSRLGGVQAFWEEQQASKTASEPKIKKTKVPLNKLIGLCTVSDELLQDVIQLESFINVMFNNEFNFKIDESLIEGVGGGTPLGIMASGCLVTQALETGQTLANGTILYKNILKMYSRLLPGSMPNAVWHLNQDLIPYLGLMDMPVGTGGMPVFLPPGGASVAPYGTLFGRPIIPLEHCQTRGTTGDIILADWSKYIVGRKNGLQTAMSIHLYFNYDKSCFRFVLRIGGQPLYSSTITPKKGSNTLSAFIVLATRS